MDDFENVINGICEDLKKPKKTAKNNNLGQDQAQKSIKNEFPEKQKTENRGRKNRGITNSNYEEFKKDRTKFRQIKQPESFNHEIIEKIQGEVIQNNDIEQFKELYKLTCYDILDKFIADNTELVKKHPYNWYKKLLLEIKKAVPPVTYKDIDKLMAIWDILSDLLDSIGLYITYESFEKMTKVYKYQLENSKKLNSKYISFVQKINKDCDSAIINELQYNPYNQTNKIFIAKSHGIVEKTEPKQIEVNHNIRNYDNISNYRIQDHN